VEADASKAAAASAANDRAAVNAAQVQAVADFSALQAADAQLEKAAVDLVTAAAGGSASAEAALAAATAGAKAHGPRNPYAGAVEIGGGRCRKCRCGHRLGPAGDGPAKSA